MSSRVDELREKASQLPLQPGVYLYKDTAGTVLYVGKAKNLRNRVRSYFNEDRLAEAKTGSLIREAHDLDYILLDNEKEALALENNLIKQYKPRFNVLLRDDKTYPYIKLTNEKWPRVYVTRRLRKDGTYFGPYFPGNLAHRLVNFIHRHFKIPSCTVDFSRNHTHPCLEFHIHRCLGPCVQGLTTEQIYAEHVRDVRMFLEGRTHDLASEMRKRMEQASEAMEFERAAALRDLIHTVEEVEQKQKMAAASGDDIDIFSSYAEPPQVAVNLFHLRNGRIVDRREFFWEDLSEYEPQEFFTTLLMQVYSAGQPVPAVIHVPLELDDREVLEELLSEKRGKKTEIHTPQRGQKRALLALVGSNARHSFEQRFRVLRPTSAAISEALEEALNLPDAPKRIECFDISHIQGTDKVASMVVWEEGRMKKSDYRKFIIRTVVGNDDFASMYEVVTRRYGRLQAEDKPMPGLVLIDGGLGQLHSAAAALEALGILNQPLASLAKREETLYVYGQEDEPILLERNSPVLHLVQMIRDEAHRFAVTFHRSRRDARTLTSELAEIPGVGPKTIEKLLKTFGSLTGVKAASEEELAAAIGKVAAAKLRAALAGLATGVEG
ncbi:excinuclease ABC subunit UvrC [Paludibaculum fermentans]|uniref:UvrABC system protein C n=1 Tax=Paludibaculum fermentans TaxID=1473598 RepID=A0A7S7NNH0_PALFE|nr:excinuclease ABC subunit UvrC [Paludibaculum fermentans]QOY86863.1 excinuclease ABC subunit UvrC [Paludibaculum fermentans]